mmetsp:Transcript_9179/g.8783  ORF Transcript_9179/g.8783 Transcript_9179/m.8783 type:complete len:154 (-) Transcript_9179:385-846(-)
MRTRPNMCSSHHHVPNYRRETTLFSLSLCCVLMSRGHSVNGEVLDDCDRFKWRQCESDQDCEWEIWKTRPYDGQINAPAMWESEQGHPNYHQYECVIPLIEGCTVKRCLPNISLDGGHHCTTSSSCPDGQICSLSELKCPLGFNLHTKYCVDN